MFRDGLILLRLGARIQVASELGRLKPLLCSTHLLDIHVLADRIDKDVLRMSNVQRGII